MKYIVNIQRVNEDYLSKGCSFPRDIDDYPAKFLWLRNSIEDIKYLETVEIDDEKIIIDLIKEVSERTLLDDMESFFSEVFCYYRFVSIRVV